MSIAIIGGYNIASYPGILRAFDPSRAVMRSLSHRSFSEIGANISISVCPDQTI